MTEETFQSGLVSVMMPVYNAAAYIGDAIRSVLAQSYTQWELIVVDDGSSDGSGDLAAAFDDPRVRVMRQPNGGEAAARNRALQAARGEYIAFLDSDDLFLPQHLERLVSVLSAQPDLQAVYGDGMYMSVDEQAIEPLSHRRRGPFVGDLFGELVRASDVFGPPICTLLRHAHIRQQRLAFDTRIVIGPDWDFFIHFAEHALFAYLPEITCRYRLHEGSISVVTNSAKRRQSLALCRENAIQITRFASLPEAVRAYAFYDLLVELTLGETERQERILATPQFGALSSAQQARLLRLTAAQSLRLGADVQSAGQRLTRARRIHPADWRAWLLDAAFRLSPSLCQRLLRSRP